MKKGLLFLAMLVFSNLFAQTSALDPKLVNIDQSSVTSGIIYERVMPMADLYEFNQNGGVHNTADYSFFEQALSELYRASNKTKLISQYELRNRILADENTKNVVNIGIINTPFQILNYNESSPLESGLNFANNLYSQISGKAPFFTMDAFVVAPLKKSVEGTTIIYKFRDDLIFNNNGQSIKTLVADLGDGVLKTIIDNGVIVMPSVTVNNSSSNADRKLIFSVTFADNIALTTYGKIYIANNTIPETSSITARTAATSNSEDLYPSNSRLQALESFQGIGETQPILGQLEARVFYGNTKRKILKPIIIIDGFDPGDTRRIQDYDCQKDPECASLEKYKTNGVFDPLLHVSIEEKMSYDDETKQSQNLIAVLQSKGFDVVIVNLPTYDASNGIKIDGGADFIERNGRTLVTLIQDLNNKMSKNGSIEKLVIVGPSMGGQISRYALAYMEKKQAEAVTQRDKDKYEHNTRLWVSFDSPNLGANIPMGDQALINLLKEDSPDAELKYNKLLGSTAAKELLMEFHQSPMVYITFPSLLSRWNGYYPNNSEVVQANLNGQTTSQGMPSNAGNAYFQTHYNNQFTNGLYKSNGYPMNLRKIAITNGSLTGKLNGIDGEKILDVRGFQRVCIKPWSRFGIGGGPSYCFTIKLAEMHAYNLPTTGSRSRIAYYNTLTSDEKQTYSPNLNYRGNMDIVPGGTANATNDINTAITGKSIFDTRGSFWQYPGDNIGYFLSNRLGGANWEVRNLTPFQTFIPTFSGLGIIEPNQSWSNALNRNLVCSGETPFDSYFGEANNTEHISLNYRSVNWLLKELGDSTTPPSPQLPSYPVDESFLEGDKVICFNANVGYSLDTCKVPSSVTWVVSPNLKVISSTGYNIVVNGFSEGLGSIKAVFLNGQAVSKTVWVGSPKIRIYQAPVSTCSRILEVKDVMNGGSVKNQGINEDQVVWKQRGRSENGFSYYFTDTRTYYPIVLSATNTCGTTTLSPYTPIVVSPKCGAPTLKFYNSKSPIDLETTDQNSNEDLTYNVYPNPAKDIINIQSNNSDKDTSSFFNVQLYDMKGSMVKSFELLKNQVTISVLDLSKGIYNFK